MRKRFSGSVGTAVAVVAASIGLLAPAAADADRAFQPRFSTNDTGAVTLTSSALMTCSTTGTSGGTCAASRATNAGPAGSATIAELSNNAYTMTQVDTDGDPATTRNSSTSELTLPADATVLFAGLYWAGDTSAGNNGGAAAPAPGQANQAKFKVPGGPYETLTADVQDTGTGTNVSRYQGFKDVTGRVRAAGPGTYAVGDLQLGTGGDRYGGWTLVVAYRDTSQPARNLTVFDGLKTIVQNAAPTTIPVSGFRTPPAGPVRTEVGFVAYEGDLGLGGDTATLNGTSLTNATNPATNFFNSSISRRGTSVTSRDPSFVNTLGYDADTFAADGVLANDATDATIRLTTSADQYLPGVITFATELFAPDVQLQKSVQNVSNPGGPDRRGDVLRYTVDARNVGQDSAQGFTLRDDIPDGATYVPGSLRVATGAGSPASPTDAVGDDRAEFDTTGDRVVYRLGTGATSSSGGSLGVGASSRVTFDVRLDPDLPPRAQVVNRASAAFVSGGLGTPLTADSNRVTTTVAAPDLTLTKTHAPAFLAGGRTTFRLVVSNSGTLATDGSEVVVTDPFPAGAQGFQSLASAGGDGWTCAIANLSLRCTRSDVVDPGRSYPPIVVDARVSDPAPASITNVSTVAGGGDADPTNNTGTDIGGTSAQADVRVTKTADPASVLSGGELTYTLDVENRGPSTATAVVVDDALPAGLTLESATSTVGTCTTAVRCSIGALADGESARITIVARVSANDRTLTNTASATSSTPDPDPSNNRSSVDTVVDPTADLRIAKTASTPTPTAPGPLSYTLRIVNDGPDAARNVEVLDQLPDGFTPTTIAPTGGLTCNTPTAGGSLRCTGAALASGGTATVVIDGTLAGSTAGATIRNSATVSSATADPDPSDNGATTSVTGTPSADVGIAKEWVTGTGAAAAVTSTDPGTTVRIRLTATNAGPSDATNVVVTDALPAGVTFVSADRAQCTETPAGTVRCAYPSIAAGSQEVALITVRVTGAGTTKTNTATIDAAQPDPISSNDQDTDRLGVTDATDLSVTKTAGAAPPAGGTTTTTLRAFNAGPSDATGVTITDVLPAGLSFVSSADGCTELNGTVTCPVGALAANASATRTFVVRVAASAAGTTITNTARIAGDQTDPEPANDRGSATLTIAPRADLRLGKTPLVTRPAVDEDTSYDLTVTNDGPNDATGVTITDPLPAGVTFVSASPGCALRAGTVTCVVGDVADGASATRRVTVRPTRATAASAIANSASVTGAEDDPDRGNNTAGATVSVPAQVDLGVTITPSTTTPTAGVPFQALVVVGNDGPSPATDTEVVIAIPDGLTATAASAGQGTCTITAREVRCAVGTVAADGGTQVLLTLVPAAGVTGDLTLGVTVDSTEADVRPQNNAAGTTVTVRAPSAAPAPAPGPDPAPGPAPAPAPTGTPNLQVEKTADKRSARLGDLVRYRITVRNRGTAAARNVQITDVFSGRATVTDVSVPGGSCVRTPQVRCTVPVIEPGRSVVMTVAGRVRASGELRNSATAVASNGGASTVSRADVAVSGHGSLAISKRASTTRPRVGQRVTFTVVVRNVSRKDAARNVVVCDPLPRGLAYVSARGATVRGGRVCWKVGTLRTGARRTLKVVVVATRQVRARRVTNTATATATGVTTRRGRATVVLPAGPTTGGGVTG